MPDQDRTASSPPRHNDHRAANKKKPPAGSPPSGPLPNGPTWRVAAAGVFGALVFFVFVGFAVAGAQKGPGVWCDAGVPLFITLALGVALAGAFIGGEIGVQGTLPTSILGAGSYAAVGGIGSFIVVFGLTSLAYNQACPADPFARLLRVQIMEVPENATVVVPEEVWIERNGNSLSVFMRPHPSATKHPQLRLTSTTPSKTSATISTSECTIKIKQLTTEYANTAGTTRVLWTRNNAEVSYGFPSDAEKATTTDCLQIGNEPDVRPIQNQIYVDDTGIVVFDRIQRAPCLPGLCARPVATLEDTPSGTSTRFAGLLDPILQFVGAAAAQVIVPATAPPSFAKYLADLIGTDSATSDAAKAALSENFADYHDQVFAVLTNPRAPSAEKVALLDTVIDAIGRAQPALLAGTTRDFTKPISLFRPGDYLSLVELTAVDESSVRLQSRRLIQKFPVDNFDAAYKQTAGLFTGDCPPAARERGFRDRLTYLRYSALYLYYNRVVDNMYIEGQLTDLQTKNMSKAYADGSSAGSCLPVDLKVDAALLDYAQALVLLNTDYNEKAGRGAVAPNAIEYSIRFMKQLRETSDNYIYPQHIIYMNLFFRGITWEAIADSRAAAQDVIIGGAGGLSNGQKLIDSHPALRSQSVDVRRYPTSSAPKIGATAGPSILLVLAQTGVQPQSQAGVQAPSQVTIQSQSQTAAQAPPWSFVKYQVEAGKVWDFGWIPISK